MLSAPPCFRHHRPKTQRIQAPINLHPYLVPSILKSASKRKEPVSSQPDGISSSPAARQEVCKWQEYTHKAVDMVSDALLTRPKAVSGETTVTIKERSDARAKLSEMRRFHQTMISGLEHPGGGLDRGASRGRFHLAALLNSRNPSK